MVNLHDPVAGVSVIVYENTVQLARVIRQFGCELSHAPLVLLLHKHPSAHSKAHLRRAIEMIARLIFDMLRAQQESTEVPNGDMQCKYLASPPALTYKKSNAQCKNDSHPQEIVGLGGKGTKIQLLHPMLAPKTRSSLCLKLD